LFFTLSLNAERQVGKLLITTF